ncbi:hypothetical protein CBD41_02580 [bacterium TMED181]|nr:hypothetical protein [Planctomycetota bacterium]OUW46409.1 MAG: hypothetical protein CBD41_02580 [bacterium TMED181]
MKPMEVLDIPREEFSERRQKLAADLNGATAVIFAGKGGGLHSDFHPDLNFQYLTGIIDEPGAILLLNPADPNPARREILFLEPHLPELERWDGWRGPIDSKLKDQFGFRALMRTSSFPQILLNACKNSLQGMCLHSISHHEQPVGPDLEVFQKLQQRIPGFRIHDGSRLVPLQRSVKSPAELAMIQRSAEITAQGFAAILDVLNPGLNEFDLQEAAEHAYRSNGSRGPFYGTIVGSGFNATILHYRDNCAPIADGDLVVIDSGARYGKGPCGYGSDVTRTYPANGRFSDRQKEVYSVVLESLETTISAVKPGIAYAELDSISRKIISEAGFGDFYPHGVGHPIGLEVHDVQPETLVPEGAIITIEPGIYLPDENMGIRIEDDILVTAEGPVNLTGNIPKTIKDIEEALANRTGTNR